MCCTVCLLVDKHIQLIWGLLTKDLLRLLWQLVGIHSLEEDQSSLFFLELVQSQTNTYDKFIEQLRLNMCAKITSIACHYFKMA